MAKRWAKSHRHWEDRETFEMTRKSEEAMLRALGREPEKLEANSTVRVPKPRCPGLLVNGS